MYFLSTEEAHLQQKSGWLTMLHQPFTGAIADPKSGSWDDYPHDGIDIFIVLPIVLMVNQ